MGHPFNQLPHLRLSFPKSQVLWFYCFWSILLTCFVFLAKFSYRKGMLVEYEIDIKENMLFKKWPELLELLLCDRTTNKNIFWATDVYERQYGNRYQFKSHITIDLITGHNGYIIKPRIAKSKKQQKIRIKDKAEVFTPSWVCNKQNNLIDNDWFGRENVFNIEHDDNTWSSTKNKIIFPDGKTWLDYVRELRMEVACGEAPYLVSRYDTTTGNYIDVSERIGLLDRKLRIVSENTVSEADWFAVAKWAYKSIYGYEWQGDSLLLAREALLFTFIDFFEEKFTKEPPLDYLKEIAEIITWNVWQMDGVRGVLPCSCCNDKYVDLLGEQTTKCCVGCKNGDIANHNGIYCYVRDWNKIDGRTKQPKKLKFISLMRNKK